MSDDKRDQRSRRRKLFGAGLRTLGRGARRVMPGYDRAQYWTQSGLDWFDTLGNLKGAAMKLGQVAAQYQDLLPPELTEQLARLQRDAQPRPFEQMRTVLDAAWGPEQWAQVESIDKTAMAAASIGQVHRARLADGRAVVVKIRYPEVAGSVDADVANLGRLLRWSRLLPIDASRLDEVLAEVRDRLAEETDYRIERDNLVAMRALELPGFVLPAPVDVLSGESVLVMEEIMAERLDGLREADQAARDRVGEALVANLARQVFTHGLLHADPHPGNYGLTADGRVAVYDFGCVKRVAPAEAEGMRRVLAASLAHDWADVHAGLADLGIVNPVAFADDPDVFADIYQRHHHAAIDAVKAEPFYDFAEGSVITRLRAEVRADLRHWRRFRPAPELVFVMRTLSGMYWLLRGIGARVPLYDMLEAVADGREDDL
ncbi:MAG: AarF/ABC1/UbiB kinase family protein [Salinisphaeraceae bacterium]